MSSIVSLTKQQIAVYKMAQADTQNKVLEYQVELSSRREAYIKPRSLPQTVAADHLLKLTPKLARLIVIFHDVLVAADKSQTLALTTTYVPWQPYCSLC